MNENLQCLFFFVGYFLICIVIVLIIKRPRKCPECSDIGKGTGMRGYKYAQYFCKNCEYIFWIQHTK